MLEALASYHRNERYGFSPPGHRQGRGVDGPMLDVLGRDLFRSDVLASGGLDDWCSSGGYLADAEELMADAVGATTTFFSTCGSSLSVRAAMMAVAGGERGGLLVPRDSHKSIVGGLIFSGIQPRWIMPCWDADRHCSHPPSPERVRQAWEQHPDAAGALIVSPSPYGTCTDLARIADLCHERGKPLIVDEAWGAHLPFHDGLPTWAMNAGADVCVVSVHKMGGGLEQGSVYHVQGDLVDQHRLSACADLLMTTSPSVLVYAVLDGWRRQMVQHGHELFDAALNLADDLRERLNQVSDVTVMGDELLAAASSPELDRLQVLMDLAETGTSGYQARDWLRQHRGLDVGLADHRRILASLSFADDQRTADRLLDAMTAWREAAKSFDRPPPVRLPSPDELELQSAMLPREAFFARTEMVPASKAVGRIAAEQITPYPPGIPAVVPGELLDGAVIEYLRSGVEAGMALPDSADPGVGHVRVVA